MHCDTSTRPIFDLTRCKAPRALHNELVRFIRGIRGPRQNAVTRKQIGDWCSRTPAEAVDAALVELVAEGKVTTVMIGGFRCRNNKTRRPMGYEVAQRLPETLS